MINILYAKEKEMPTVVSILRAKEYKGFVSIYFEKISHLLEYDIILSVLVEELKCEVLTSFDLVYHKHNKLRWQNIEFELRHEDFMGNFIRTVPENADILEQLANQAADIINENIEKVRKSKGKRGKKGK